MFEPLLSPREIEVIELIAEGLTDKEIAARLNITTRTVSEHLTNIRSKLGASNRASAVYRYFYALIGQRARLIESRHAPEENTMTTQTTCTLRPPNPDTDIPALVPMTLQLYMSTWFGSDSFLESPTETTMSDHFRQRMSNAKHYWRVAEDSQGNVLGYSHMHHEPWDSTGGRDLIIMVKPDKRNQGIGTALYDNALRMAQEQGASGLHALVAEHNGDALRFAYRRGFIQTAQHLAFELDLARFNEKRFAHVMEFSRQTHVRITSLAEFNDSEAARRKLFQLNAWVHALDLLGYTDEPAWDSFEHFNEHVCGSSWYQPEGQIIAIDEKTGEWIGMAATTVNASGASNLHTGVDRRYRHNPMIGQALKLSSILYARQKGAALLRDDCVSRDATNLAINYVMGYQIKSSLIYLERSLKP
jgi:DNA-binding CsgD family transcriptional regulator/ribosomal protein S18 acetylase RimI-like enzyme